MFSSTTAPSIAHRRALSIGAAAVHFGTSNKSIFEMKDMMRPNISKFLVTKDNNPPSTSSQPQILFETAQKPKKALTETRGLDLGRCIAEIQTSIKPLQAKNKLFDREIQTTMGDGPLLQIPSPESSTHRRLNSMGGKPLTAKSTSTSIFSPKFGARLSFDLGTELNFNNSPTASVAMEHLKQPRMIESRSTQKNLKINNSNEDSLLASRPLTSRIDSGKKGSPRIIIKDKRPLTTFFVPPKDYPLYVQGVAPVSPNGFRLWTGKTERRNLQTASVRQKPGKMYRTASAVNFHKTQTEISIPRSKYVSSPSQQLLMLHSKTKEKSYLKPRLNVEIQMDRKKGLPALFGLFSP